MPGMLRTGDTRDARVSCAAGDKGGKTRAEGIRFLHSPGAIRDDGQRTSSRAPHKRGCGRERRAEIDCRRAAWWRVRRVGRRGGDGAAGGR